MQKGRDTTGNAEFTLISSPTHNMAIEWVTLFLYSQHAPSSILMSACGRLASASQQLYSVLSGRVQWW